MTAFGGTKQLIATKSPDIKFVQKSIRRVTAVSGESLEYPDRVGIDDLTGLAFAYLGQGGLIEGARNHSHVVQHGRQSLLGI